MTPVLLTIPCARFTNDRMMSFRTCRGGVPLWWLCLLWGQPVLRLPVPVQLQLIHTGVQSEYWIMKLVAESQAWGMMNSVSQYGHIVRTWLCAGASPCVFSSIRWLYNVGDNLGQIFTIFVFLDASPEIRIFIHRTLSWGWTWIRPFYSVFMFLIRLQYSIIIYSVSALDTFKTSLKIPPDP